MALRYILRKNEILNNIEKKDSFLEIGGGNLKLSQKLLDSYKKGVTYEPAPKTRSLYKQLPEKYKERLTFYPELFSNDNEVGKRYDLVLACEVLEHIDDDILFMRMLLERMEDEGRVIVSVPARMKFWSYHDEVVGHVRRYELEDFKRIFSEIEGYQYKVIAYGYPFINLLRYMRILYAKIYMKGWEDLEADKQTEMSGTEQELKNISRMSNLIEKLRLASFMSWIASHFNSYNLSEGYIVIIQK